MSDLKLDLTGGWSQVRLRPATLDDKAILDVWDQDPDVKSSSNDDHVSGEWLKGEDYWTHELSMQSDVYEYFIAELRSGERDEPREGPWRPIAAMQIIDPYLEPTHYWGKIEPNLRALDIWIGSPQDRGRGLGEIVMRMAIDRCFEAPQVTAIIIDPLNSNTRAHKFYQRIGFVPTHRQTFNDEDDCLVHRLTRAEWRERNPRIQGDCQ
jgi:aminoglycoside 6'-N-acetyltransferase